ncbi:IST1-like protein [Apiospora arundinis]
MAPSATLLTRIKVQLKLAIARLRMVQKRDEALSKAARRTMAQLLETGKVDSARIRVENIIRTDIITELHEILELYCELLIARAGLLEAPQCDPGLEEAVKSIIYAAPKTEIKELQAVRLLFGEKFGKEFVFTATENSDDKVSEKVVKKLSVTPPREELVTGYLEEIARAYGVDWPKRPANLGDPRTSAQHTGRQQGGTGKRRPQPSHTTAHPRSAKSPSRQPPSPSTENPRPKITLNSAELGPSKKMLDAGISSKKAERKGGLGDDVPSVDDLAARFAALKR